MEFKRDISGVWKDGLIGGGANGGGYRNLNFTHLKIKKSNKYYIYNSGNLIVSGNYSLDESEFGTNKYREPFTITFRGPENSNLTFFFNENLYVSMFSDTLILSPNCPDCLQIYFKRE